MAMALGYYKTANLTVNMLNPAHDSYKSTPASRVASGQATFAVAPSESVVSYNSQPESSTKPRLQVCVDLKTHYLSRHDSMHMSMLATALSPSCLLNTLLLAFMPPKEMKHT